MIGLIDRRLSHFKTASKMKLCDYVYPKTVSLHPTKTNVVFLAPIDKGCGIFDMRKQVRRCKGDTAFSSIEPLVHLKVRYTQTCFKTELEFKCHKTSTRWSSLMLNWCWYFSCSVKKWWFPIYCARLNRKNPDLKNLYNHY